MRKKGVTLIELILVLAIISVLGALSTGFYSRFLTQNAVANTTDRMVQNLRKAQTFAMASRKSSSTGWGVNVNNATKIMTLYQGGNYAGRTQALDETFTYNSNIGITGLTDVNFARLTGIPNSPGTYTISAQNNNDTVTINAQGMVTR